MGRVQLSTAFGIDGPRRTTSLKYPEPPLYIEAPFDFDSDVDAPDTVYEAFLTREELAARDNTFIVVGNNSAVIPSAAAIQAARETAPSPIESDESSNVTVPPTRIPSPVREDRRDAPSPSDLSTPVGSRILQLLEPLALARDNAMPAVNAVLAEAAGTDVVLLVARIASIIRPQIESALAPFLEDIPQVEYFGRTFESSLLLELLGGRFSRTAILAALDSFEEMSLSVAPAVQVVEEAASESDSDFSLDTVSDDLAMSDTGTDSRSPSPGSWSGRSAQPSPSLQPSNNTATTPSTLTVNPALVPTAPSARTHVLDVDTDDDAHSTSSSSAAASSTSGPGYSMQSGIRNFTPRVFRARDAVVRPQVILDEGPGTNFHPVHQQRVLAPMR
ncbi:hypothetical protein M407DRAFT_240758 [Tulasnella calospora MUT 4182]|uniref:Uncharacterized protein n=1 Tax=Tulasnella calospora MUT 4182 TaxID=1051891 RepID=A0A0C3LJ95_9AGAM|nr:hypothetical protein M407DRAFT_240758 [Tulasnella calospora MUT 4182]